MELVKKNKKVLSTVRLFMHVYGADGAGCGGGSLINANCPSCTTNVGCVNE